MKSSVFQHLGIFPLKTALQDKKYTTILRFTLEEAT